MLQCASVAIVVGESVPADMPEHVRVDKEPQLRVHAGDPRLALRSLGLPKPGSGEVVEGLAPRGPDGFDLLEVNLAKRAR